MKILLIGKNGQLGWELQRTCLTLGEVIPVDYPDVDLSQTDGLRDLIRTVKPNLIINAAAYTNVDKAESEPELARKVNTLAPAVMAEEIKKLNGALIHYSTDYVFDGTKGSTYIETDLPKPLNVYGATKLEGEELVLGMGVAFLIFRTSWIYTQRTSAGNMRQGGFMNKVLEWARQNETLRIVDDQIGSPTWARMLAEATAQVITQGRQDPVGYLSEKRGLYHLAGDGFASRFEWVKKIIELDPDKSEHRIKEILPALTSDFPTPAKRPLFSALDCKNFATNFGLRLPAWEAALRMAMEN
jgi:dTDP-4-dehydrorhamnose reductase